MNEIANKTLEIHLADYNEKIALAIEAQCECGGPCVYHRDAALVRSVKP